MKLNDRTYTRADLMRYAGDISQIGGVRRYTLAEGRARGTDAFDVDTGAGLRFTVLPDRGMDVSMASYKGVNLVYRTPNGEAHPSYYEAQGAGWLRTFFGGLLTTCGLTTIGAPGMDGAEELPLHGRYSTTPARQVCDRSRWEGDEYIIELSGVMDEAILFGDKIRLTRTISTRLGATTLAVDDVAENIGCRRSPFTILYHINFGFPLLAAGSRAIISAVQTTPANELSARAMGQMLEFSDPIAGFQEMNYTHRMGGDASRQALAAVVNPALCGGLGVCVRFGSDTLPYLNEWKMMGEGDYVAALEPCNAPCENRGALRKKNLLPFLDAGETRAMHVEFAALDGKAQIAETDRQSDKIIAGRKS